MTNLPAEIYAPDARVENDVVAELAREAVEPVKVEDGLYLLHDGKTVDLRSSIEARKENPDRKKGIYAVSDVDAFLQYLEKHGEDHTELWANDKKGTIRAVINAHTDRDDIWPGWEDHVVTLRLPFSKDWLEWVNHDGQQMSQAAFAEFIEDHLPNFVTPSGADMLELAQTFQATSTVDFESSQRLKSGETTLAYVETTNAKAGTKGALTIPDTFELALQVHERGPVYRVQARFRYRINGGNLTLAYRLSRIDDVRRHAFDEVSAVVRETGRQVWNTP